MKKITIIIFLLSCAVLYGQKNLINIGRGLINYPPAAAPPSNIPLAIYLLNNNANDSLGVYNLTENLSPSYVTGVEGNAIYCNGNNVGAIGSFPYLSDYTVSARFNIRTNTITSFVESEINTPRLVNFRIIYYDVNDFRLIMYDGSTLKSLKYTGSISLTDWHFVAATYDSGTNTATLQIDNNTPISSTMIAVPANSNYELGIGSFKAASSADGYVDQLRIYDKALTPTEITTLYNRFAP